MSAKVVVVTGANRGIGLAICKTLAETLTSQHVIYAVTRRGTALGLTSQTPGLIFKYGVMDLQNKDTMIKLAERIKHEDGGCDVLLNVAGIYHYDTNLSGALRREMVDVNYRGSLEVCEAFVPILKKDGRIVNVASESGYLGQYGRDLQKRFRRSSNTLEDIERLAQEYEAANENGEVVKKGWARKPYFVSKTLQIAMTMAFAQQHPEFHINACCPGWVQTELGNQAGAAPKTPEEGARVPIRVGLGDIGGVTGKWWANPNIDDTGEGAVKSW